LDHNITKIMALFTSLVFEVSKLNEFGMREDMVNPSISHHSL
jgi:hypothetical protein